MCGIAGLLLKAPGRNGPVGDMMIKMLACLDRRGPDSSGLALYREGAAGYTYSLVYEGPAAERERALRYLHTHVGNGFASSATRVTDQYVFVDVDPVADPLGLVGEIEQVDGFKVVGVGRAMTLVKDTVLARKLDEKYGVSRMQGRYAIGHTRAATESRVDVLHGHPLWSRYAPDVSIVHNGHITSDYRLRNRLRVKGYRFQTDNDSEVIAVYISDKLKSGKSLQEAMTDSMQELDGTFAYMVATADAVGIARDPFGLKPLLVAETDDMIAFASENASLRAVVGETVPMWEVQAGEVYVWQ